MFIGSIVFEIHIPYSQSLKEKRTVIRSLKEKLRNKFNVSVSEVGEMDKHQKSVVAVVLVGADQGHIEKSMDSIINFVEVNYPEIYIQTYREII
jgi:uncharacterized protein YlxP (DUF503 family)